MNYNTRVVSGITGLSFRQIDYWDRSHFIKPSVSDASGRGSVRLYSFTDLVQMRVAKTLLDKGITLQKIRKAINYLKRNMPEVERPLSEMRFLTDGETIFVLTRDRKKIVDTLKSGQIVFSIALGEIVEDLKGELAAFGKDKRYEVKVKGERFGVTLHAIGKGNSYGIECPSLSGCTSQGDTVEEALAAITDAIGVHLGTLRDGGKVREAS